MRLAAAEEGVDYGGPDGSVVVSAEKIVLAADRQWADSVLYTIVVDVVSAVKDVAA